MGKRDRYTLNRRLGGPQTGLDVFKKGNISVSVEILNPDFPAHNLWNFILFLIY
jgi:hypothetical protein